MKAPLSGEGAFEEFISSEHTFDTFDVKAAAATTGGCC